MIDLYEEIKLYKSKVAFYESQNNRGEYSVTVRELKYVVEILETLRSERTTGDCISREDLKKAIEPYRYAICGFEGILALIDNAQVIEPDSRPKGTWKLVVRDNKDIDVVCPICNRTRFPAYSHGYTLEELEEYLIRQHLPQFCESCGADMRGATNGN